MLALLRLLQDGRFHSGEALGAALGVSRSAVWKQLQVLQAELSLACISVQSITLSILVMSPTFYFTLMIFGQQDEKCKFYNSKSCHYSRLTLSESNGY